VLIRLSGSPGERRGDQVTRAVRSDSFLREILVSGQQAPNPAGVLQTIEQIMAEGSPRPACNEWEHSIPGVDQLRYSLTFRKFGTE
jgi:hypothetical protein